MSVLQEIEKSYRVERRELWSWLSDPGYAGLVYRPYEESQDEIGLGNLETEEVSVQWHRFPGNMEMSDIEWSPEQWTQWYEKTVSMIRAPKSSASI